jgi:hypothetical protein
MNESETIDPELWVMRHMNADELDRFTNVLETIEREQAWLDKFHSETDPSTRLMALPAKERETLMEHMNRWKSALEEKTNTVGKYADQVYAWAALIDYSLAAIECLFDQGKFHLGGITERSEFWRLVYHRILSDRGAELGKDSRFRNVKILEALKDYVAECLPGFAERFRERGNPILAQFLEELADA